MEVTGVTIKMAEHKIVLKTMAIVEAKNKAEAIEIAKKGRYPNGEELGYEYVDRVVAK